MSSEPVAQDAHTIIETILATPTPIHGISGINQAKNRFGHFMLGARNRRGYFCPACAVFIYSLHSKREDQTGHNVDLSLHEYDPVDWRSLRNVVPIYAAASPNENDDSHDESENGNDPAAGLQAALPAEPTSRKSADHSALTV